MYSRLLPAIALLVAACTGEAPEPSPPASPQPSAAHAETFGKNCQWGEVKSAGLSIWSYACGPSFGSTRLVADESLPGFQIESVFEGKASRGEAIRIFSKDPSAPIEAVLPAVRAASPGPSSAACILTERPALEGEAVRRYAFVPPPEVMAAWEKSLQAEVPDELPCGEYGPRHAGEYTFQTLDGAPDKVVMINWGSEIQIFDASTLKASP